MPTAKEGAKLSPGQDFKLPVKNLVTTTGGISAGFSVVEVNELMQLYEPNMSSWLKFPWHREANLSFKFYCMSPYEMERIM